MQLKFVRVRGIQENFLMVVLFLMARKADGFFKIS